jgi:signal transduction histidine kinase/Flp pilus assembly protein TadD
MILLMLFPLALLAGSAREDSILILLPRLPDDSNKVFTYNELFKLNFSIDSKKAEKWGKEGLHLAEKLNFQSGIAKMSNNLGVLQSKMGNYTGALEHYERSYQIRVLAEDSLGMAICLSNIGAAYYKRGMYKEAIEHHGDALGLFVQQNDTVGILGALNNIGSIYNEQGKFEDALNSYFFVLRLREKRHDKSGLASSQYNVGTIYHRMGMLEEAIQYMDESLETYREQNDLFGLNYVLSDLAAIRREMGEFEESQRLYEEAMVNAEALNDRFSLANCISGLAMLAVAKGDFRTAETELKDALKIYRQIASPKSEAETLNLLGAVLLKQNQHKQAIGPLTESLALAKHLEARDLIRDNHHLLAEAEAAIGNHKSAYGHFLDFFALHDSIYSQAKSAQYAELNSRYRTREQQLEIQRLNLQREKDNLWSKRLLQRNYLLFGGLIVLFLVVLTLFFRYRKKQKRNLKIEQMNREIEAQRDRMKSQNDQIREINTNLERIIDTRTAAVVAAKNELDTFLYESAHALRRPLTRIEGLSQLMEIETNPENHHDLRAKMTFTVKGMDRLLHKLIMVNDNEQRQMELEELDPQALVQEIEKTLEAPHLAVHLDLPAEFELYSDHYLIHILLLNLIENAAHFCAPPEQRPAECTVRFSYGEDTVVIEVQDNGLGVAEDHLPQVFEMFYRAHIHNGSNGLGLYVVRKVVDRLHGEVEIDSEEGQWTRVRVVLPRHYL